MSLCLKKNFPETNESFKHELLLMFLWLCHSPSENKCYCLSWVLFAHYFPSKSSRVKDLFSEPFMTWPGAVLYVRAHCEGKKKKIDSSHKAVKILHFLTWPIFDAVISEIKGSSHDIKILCDRKHKQEVEENHKVLTPITDTIAILERLDLPLSGHHDGSKHHPKV